MPNHLLQVLVLVSFWLQLNCNAPSFLSQVGTMTAISVLSLLVEGKGAPQTLQSLTIPNQWKPQSMVGCLVKPCHRQQPVALHGLGLRRSVGVRQTVCALGRVSARWWDFLPVHVDSSPRLCQGRGLPAYFESLLAGQLYHGYLYRMSERQVSRF